MSTKFSLQNTGSETCLRQANQHTTTVNTPAANHSEDSFLLPRPMDIPTPRTDLWGTAGSAQMGPALPQTNLQPQAEEEQ